MLFRSDIYNDLAIGGDDPGSYFDLGYLQRPDFADLWLATREERVVGMCGLLIDGEDGEVEPIVVTSALRSQGIGRQLLQTVTGEAKRRNLRALTVRPVARNVEALQLFHDAGFRILGGHIDLLMELRNDRTWKTGVSLHGKEFKY